MLPRLLPALRASLHRLRHDRRAISSVEFALIVPVLLLFLAAATEMSWFVTAHYKVTRAASVLADLSARAEQLRDTDLQDIFFATSFVVAPMDFRGSGRAVVSSVDNMAGTGATVTWQRNSTGGIEAASKIGGEGASPTLGGGITVADGESLIVAEAFLDYRPLLGLVDLQFDRVYARAIERPRFGSVTLLITP